MALDINGYNDAFKIFVQFAEQNKNVDKGRTILDAKIESPLNGRIFTDRFDYDMSHRAAGNAEKDLLKNLQFVLQCVKHYGGIDPATFFHKPGEEVQA